MFTNILLFSLVTLIYKINCDDGNKNLKEKSTLSFLDEPLQHEDLNFSKMPRAIRTPFRNTEIMTARGFGKRNNEIEQGYANGNGLNNNQEVNNYVGSDEDKVQRSYFYPYFQDIFKLPRIVQDNNGILRNHRIQLRDGALKFRLNDGNLRIGRGFGKRSSFIIPSADERINSDSVDALKELMNQMIQLKFKDGQEEI